METGSHQASVPYRNRGPRRALVRRAHVCCSARGRVASGLRQPRPDPEPHLSVLYDGAGAVLESAGGLCWPDFGRPAGLCRLGGYLLFALTLPGGINPLLAIPVVGVVSAALALPTALIVFRLRGAYFAIGTWVVAEVYRLVFAQFRMLGGGTGTSLDPSSHVVRARHRMGQGDAECPHAGGARHHLVLARAGADGRYLGARLFHAALAPRAGAWRDPRQRNCSRRPRRRYLPRQAWCLCRNRRA